MVETNPILTMKAKSFVCILLLLASCAGEHYEDYGPSETKTEAYDEVEAEPMMAEEQGAEAPLTEENEPQALASGFTNFNLEKLNKKLIKSAEIKFNVANVRKTSLKIENLVAKYEGFVARNAIESEALYQNTLPISKDSSLHSRFYRVHNNLIVRVPSASVDSFMRALNPMIQYLDHQRLEVNDVTLDVLSNELNKKRYATSANRVNNSINQRDGDVQKATSADDRLLQRELAADYAEIARLRLEDQIMYSTIQLHIYQKESVYRELIKDLKDIEAYEPSLGTKLKEAFVEGWEMMKAFIVGMARLWAFGLLTIAAILGISQYRQYRKRKKK